MTRTQGAHRLASTQTDLAPLGALPTTRARGVSRRRRVPIRRIVLIVVLVLPAVIVGGSALLWSRASAFNDKVSTASAFSSKLWGPLGGSQRVNVLLIGHSPGERDGPYLADSLTVLSIDPGSRQTTAISIPRDLWIQGNAALPGNGKVNEAFAVGYMAGGFPEAGSRTSRLISDVAGLRIDGWISLDFLGFAKMVEAVDGITLDNPRTFRWALGADQLARKEYAGSFRAGEIDLGGIDAMRYARARYTDTPIESSDFARADRQQLILGAIRNRLEVGVPGLMRGLALLDALGGRLHTNLSVIDLSLLAEHLSPNRRVRLAEGKILEAKRNSVGSYILLAIGRSSASDLRPLRTYIARALANPETVK